MGLKKDEEICCFFVLNLQELRVIVVQREQLLKHTNIFNIFLFHRQTITNTRTSNIAAVCKDSKKRATIPFCLGSLVLSRLFAGNVILPPETDTQNN